MEVKRLLTACAWRPYAALAALAVLLGPVRAYIVPAANDALFRHDLAAEAISSLAAGLLLFAVPGPRAAQQNPQRSRAIWVLLLPTLAATLVRAHILPFLPHRELEWGTAAALSLASPLWLALLAAAQLISVEVPRTLAGAAIASISTVFLVLDTPSYIVTAGETGAFVTALALSILTVATWTYAATRLRRKSVIRCAAHYLLLRAAFDAAFSIVLERTSLRDVAWREAVVLLALDAALTAAAMLLWFYLLRNLSLAAFILHPLAIWTASLVAGLLTFGLANWRMDFAAAVALAALWSGLRSRTAHEQPLALELR